MHFYSLRLSIYTGNDAFTTDDATKYAEARFYTGRLNFLPCITLVYVCQYNAHHNPPVKEVHSQSNEEHSLGIVYPKEIRVENRLQCPGQPRDLIHVTFRKVPVKPVEYIERSVYTKCKKVVRCDCLCFSCPLQHEELGKNCNRFEPD